MLKKYFPYLIYGLITVSIMFPLYHRGMVFFLDMVFPPQFQLSDYMEEGIPAQFPIHLILQGLNLLMPMDTVEKILLSVLLFLPGVLMYKLVKHVLSNNSTEERVPRDEDVGTEEKVTRDESLGTQYSVLGTLFWPFLAGLIYMLNPWTYERFLSGHWYVYLGYAVFPLFVYLSLKLFQNQTKKSFFAWLAMAAVYPIINFHWAYIATGFFAIFFLIYFWMQKNSRPKFKKLLLCIIVAGIIIAAVNSYWALEFGKPQKDFNQISTSDLGAYATLSDATFGTYFNVLSLYGFWNQDYFLPKDHFSYWWLITLVLIILGGIGEVRAWLEKNPLFLTATIIFIPALILAVGVSSTISRPIVEFLFQYLSGFKGLRETQKIAGLLAFSYALLVPLGAKFLTSYVVSAFDRLMLRKVVLSVLLLGFAMVPLASVYSMFWGFSGQVKLGNYPSSWFAANEFLDKQSDVDEVLFLPWYGYLRLPFANNKLIANPSARFFNAPVVAGKNIENYHLPDYGESNIDQVIAGMVDRQNLTVDDLGYLKSINISHIILVDELDRDKYSFLESSTYLEKSLEFNDLVVYKIK